MPVSTPGAVRRQIAAGQTDPIYVIQGEDEIEKSALAAEFAELVEEGLRAFNVERIHAGDMTTGDRLASGVSDLVAAARTLPMMAPRRIVVVTQAELLVAPRRESVSAERALDELEALIKSPEPMTTLVLVAGPIDKRGRMYKLLAKHATIVECGAPADQAEAAQWIRARVVAAGAEIEAAAARWMAARAGFDERPDGAHGDVKRLRGEVERLLLYALGQRRITMDDVKQVAGPQALKDDWAMANAIEAGAAGDALRQVALLFDAGAAAEQILGQIAWVVRAKFPQVAPGRVSPAVDAVFRTDLNLKRSNRATDQPRMLLERLVVELCEGARQPSPRGRR